MSEPLKAAASLLATGLTWGIIIPYVRAIRRGHVRPHVFSWIVWALTTLLAFAAQWADGAGWGAWPIGVSGLVTAYIAWLAAQHEGDASRTRMDWAFLIGALAALPCWWITSDPLGAVIVLTLVDLLGFGPTLRRAWERPGQESPGFYAWFTLRNGLVLVALEHYSWATALFPSAVGIACAMVVALLLIRRRLLRTAAPQ